jgi:hypothetical protein
MFSFFGAFADDHPGLAAQFQEHWPEVDVVEINKPFRGLAVRFGVSVYDAENEDVPEAVSNHVQELSRKNPSVRIVLLRTECWGGDCFSWGQFILDGHVVVNEVNGGRGTLGRLMSNLGVDLGPSELFEPLSRTFVWKVGQ